MICRLFNVRAFDCDGLDEEMVSLGTTGVGVKATEVTGFKDGMYSLVSGLRVCAQEGWDLRMIPCPGMKKDDGSGSRGTCHPA